MHINELKDKHKGGEIAILGNGLSLHRDIEDLKTDKIPTIGVNASWRHYKATYQLCLDWEQVAAMAMASYDHKKIIVSADYQYKVPLNNKIYAIKTAHCYKVKLLFSKKLAFSTEVETKGINVCMSSPWAALQIANMMLGGEGRVYMMGMDLGGPRIEGHPTEGWKILYDNDYVQLSTRKPQLPPKSFLAQYELMGYLRGLIDEGNLGIKVFLSENSSSNIRGIPRVKYLSRGKNPEKLYEGPDDKLQIIPIDAKTMRWMQGKK